MKIKKQDYELILILVNIAMHDIKFNYSTKH